MSSDGFEGYDRFIYRELSGDDLAPPHAIYDAHTKTYVGGTFSTPDVAQAFASGMNHARELLEQKERTVRNTLENIRMALSKIDGALK